MTKLIFVRHGYSEYNQLKKFTGHLDIPLATLGKEQAEVTTKYVQSAYKIDAVYSSDLSRAVQTAQPVATALGLPIVTDERLRELHLGVWTDMYIAEVKEKYPAEWEVYQNGGRCLGGESEQELQIRAVQAVREIAQKNEGKMVLITTHGGTLRAILRYCYQSAGEDENLAPIATNNSVTEIHYTNGEFRIVKVSYDEFLNELRIEQENVLN